MTVVGAAKYFRVHPATIRSWIRRGCPVIELGGVGRNHSSKLDAGAVENWLIERRVPSAAARVEQDILGIAATALYDVLKRDGLAGQTLAAERVVLMIYERLYRNVKQTPLEAKDVPAEMKRIVTNYIDCIEENGTVQRWR